MPAPLILPIGAGLQINGNKLTDHNRESIVTSPSRIENRKRMANGTMRTFVVAQKRKIKTSWDNLPGPSNKTVDGFWGFDAMLNFYNATYGEFTLTITYGDNSTEDVLVMFDDFSPALIGRGSYYDMYTLDITFEEV